MIKRLMILLVLVCTALSQGAIAIPPFMLGESLAESREHAPLNYLMKIKPKDMLQPLPLPIVIYRHGSNGMRFYLDYYAGSLVGVRCEFIEKDPEHLQWYRKFVLSANEGFGYEGKEKTLSTGYVTRWENETLEYAVFVYTTSQTFQLEINAKRHLWAP
jgi:hypothetical protein